MDALFLLDQRIRSEHIEVEQLVEPPCLEVLCDANRLEQVIVNLLSNALDAMADTSTRRVKVVARQTDGLVAIEVHDSGTGISDAVLPHLFEPFFTTKEQGVGMGLGLAISAGIVRDFGGTLRAGASELGGAMFVVQLKSAHPDEARSDMAATTQGSIHE